MAVRHELKASGTVAAEDHSFRVSGSTPGHDRRKPRLANHYETGDIVRYARGSKTIGIEAASYGTVAAINPSGNLLTVEKQSGGLATYDPRGF